MKTVITPARFAARGDAARTGWASIVFTTAVVAASAPVLAQVPFSCPGPSPDEWLTLAGTSMREAVRGAAPPRLDITAWSVARDEDGNDIAFYSQAPLAITGSARASLVLALGQIMRLNDPTARSYLIAFSRDSGESVWEEDISTPVSESFSGVTVDPLHDTAIVCSGRKVAAFRLRDGEPMWQRQLTRSLVNAMPAITTDLGGANRLFITDFDGTGSAAKLYCLNTDAFDAVLNPYQPGEIVWSTPIGASSGNTPAYLPACQGGAGLVYVATPGPSGINIAGVVRAFDATQNNASLIWQTSNIQATGFFGGVAVAPPAATGAPPRVYAASFAFNGDQQQNSSNMLRLDGLNGDIVWSVACNRSSTIPIPLPDGRVLLSTGLQSDLVLNQPSLQLFVESTSEAQPLATLAWDTSLATWEDLNGNGFIDPGEYLNVGGWTEQPVLITAGGRNLAAVGVLASGFSTNDPSAGLYLLDIDQHPTSPGFVVSQSSPTAAGGSVAVAGTSMASIGPDGLTMFGATPDDLDVNGDKAQSIDDLYSWESGSGHRDVNGDQTMNSADRAVLIRSLRPTWPMLGLGVLP